MVEVKSRRIELEAAKNIGKKTLEAVAKVITYPFIMATALRREKEDGFLTENLEEIQPYEEGGNEQTAYALSVLNFASYFGIAVAMIDNPWALGYSALGISTNVASGLYEWHRSEKSNLEEHQKNSE